MVINGASNAMLAHQQWLGVSANNVANVSSDRFRAGEGMLNEGPDKIPTLRVATTEPDPLGRSNVDLAEELTDQIVQSAGFAAQAPVIKTQDAMFGVLLDIKA